MTATVLDLKVPLQNIKISFTPSFFFENLLKYNSVEYNSMQILCSKIYTGGIHVAQWLTPEEAQKKKKKQQILLYISIPLIGGLVGAIITLLISAL